MTKVLDENTLNALAEAVKPHPLSAERKQNIRNRVFARIDPPAPEGTRTVRAGERKWFRLFQGVEISILRQDSERRNQTALWRMEPGAVIPAHVHTQQEEFIVLEGECRVGDHWLGKGDAHMAQAGCSHPPVTTDTGVLVLMRSEIYTQPSV